MGRQSMPVRHNSRNWLRRSLYGLLIVFLAVLIAAVCIFSVVNANGLQTAVDRRTKAYVSDVTFQMAQNIDAQGCPLTFPASASHWQIGRAHV